MSQSLLSLAGSEVSTRASRFVSDSRVVQIKVEVGGSITGSANRLSSVFPGRKLDGGTLQCTNSHTHTPGLLGDRECIEDSTHSADWHFESASSTLKLHITFLSLISVSVHQRVRICPCPHKKHPEHPQTHTNIQARAHSHTFTNNLIHSAG